LGNLEGFDQVFDDDLGHGGLNKWYSEQSKQVLWWARQNIRQVSGCVCFADVFFIGILGRM